MEWRFSNNSLDFETQREFFKREGSAIIYRKGGQLEREGDAARYYVSGICFTRLQQRHIIHQVVLVQENVGSLTTSPTFGDCLLSKTLNQIQCFLLKFIEFRLWYVSIMVSDIWDDGRNKSDGLKLSWSRSEYRHQFILISIQGNNRLLTPPKKKDG